MTFRVCIYPTGRCLGRTSHTLVLDAETVAQAIAIGTARVKPISVGADPPAFEIFDPDGRLVLSFTFAARPVTAPSDLGLHPDGP